MTVSRWPFLLTLGISCASCSTDKTGIVYCQPLLKEKIVAYIHSPVGQADKEKVLSVKVMAHQDTVKVELVPAYPDVSQIAVIGHDTLARFHVFFVGEPMPVYYRIQDANPQAAEIALKDLISTRYGNHPLPGFNYQTFCYWFVNKRLIKECQAGRCQVYKL
jgi:hypothetical protein